ncbi:MAG: FecR domain-containing protein [Deltaproteobacteria bacterium]|nr:FecR domain-containing protein [Deltaproteobacteria bacterium]
MRRTHATGLILLAFILLGWLLPAAVPAAVVGAMTQVEGQVEILKGGKLPAVPAKVKDGLEPLDMIRTKSKSRAQVRFIDDTLLTIAPSSSIVIQEYMYDGAKGSRQATLQLSRGLVYTVINRIHKTEQPDFIMKTHTAVLGVRGTRFFSLVGVKYTAFFQEVGLTEVGNVSPAIPQRVKLVGQEYSIVKTARPPLPPRRLTEADLMRLRQWLKDGVPERFLQFDPVDSLWEPPPPRSTVLPPGPVGPERLPEGLFKPPTLGPSPGHTPHHPL